MATKKVPTKARSAAKKTAKPAKKAQIAQKISKTGVPKSVEAKPRASAVNKSKLKPVSAPVVYSDEMADRICSRIAQGESMVNICKDAGMPNRQTFMRWLLEDKHEGLRDKYARAREEQADFYAEQIIEIADEECTTIKHGDGDEAKEVEVAFDSAAVARNRLRVDARKWYASKVAPKKYGDKLAVGQADDLLPLVTIKDLTGRKD